MRKYTFYSPTGEAIRTTVKEFSAMTGIRRSNARSLACAHFQTFRGWISGHPKVAKRRKRFLTVLVNPTLSKRDVIGQSVTSFAKRHSLYANEVYMILSGKSICYRGWMLEASHTLAQGAIADGYL